MPKPRIHSPKSHRLPRTSELSSDSGDGSPPSDGYLKISASLDNVEGADFDIKKTLLDQLSKYRNLTLSLRKGPRNSRSAVLSFETFDSLNSFKRAILDKRDRIMVGGRTLFFNFNQHQNSADDLRRFPRDSHYSRNDYHSKRRMDSPASVDSTQKYSKYKRYDSEDSRRDNRGNTHDSLRDHRNINRDIRDSDRDSRPIHNRFGDNRNTRAGSYGFKKSFDNSYNDAGFPNKPYGNRSFNKGYQDRSFGDRSYGDRGYGDRNFDHPRYNPKVTELSIQTRTLFIGNLDDHVTEAELKEHFAPFGELIEVVIKPPNQSSPVPFAFVKYRCLSNALKARESLQSIFIGKTRVKIGFGRAVPSLVVWIGGLNQKTTKSELDSEVRRFARFTNSKFCKEKGYAYYAFERTIQSRDVKRNLSNVKLPESGAVLETDYADAKQEIPEITKYEDVSSGSQPEYKRSSPDRRRYRSRSNDKRVSKSRSRSNLSSRRRFDDSPRKRPVNAKRGSISEKDYESSASSRSPSTSRSRRKSPIPRTPERKSTNRRSYERSIDRKSSASPIDSRGSRRDSRVGKRSQTSTSRPKSRQEQNSDYHRASSVSSRASSISEAEFTLKPKIPEERKVVKTISNLLENYPISWKGSISFKDKISSIQLHLICGKVDAISSMVYQATLVQRESQSIKLSSKMSMVPEKLEEIRQKLASAIFTNECCILVGLQGNSKPKTDDEEAVSLKKIIECLQKAQIAGVDRIGSASVYAFPPSNFSQEQLSNLLPQASNFISTSDSYLLVVVTK